MSVNRINAFPRPPLVSTIATRQPSGRRGCNAASAGSATEPVGAASRLVMGEAAPPAREASVRGSGASVLRTRSVERSSAPRTAKRAPTVCRTMVQDSPAARSRGGGSASPMVEAASPAWRPSARPASRGRIARAPSAFGAVHRACAPDPARGMGIAETPGGCAAPVRKEIQATTATSNSAS